MSALTNRLARMVDGMPPGSAVSLPVDWLRGELEKEKASQVAGRELLTLKEVAEKCGRAVSTVRTWCNEGKLKGAFRLRGRDWRVPEEALRAFLDAEAVPERPETAPPIEDTDLGSWRRIRAQRKGVGP